MKIWLAFCLIQQFALVMSGSLSVQTKTACQEYNVCQASGVCYISAQRYKCKCPIGRTGNLCEKSLDACSLSPCKYGCQVSKDFQFVCQHPVVDNSTTYHFDGSGLLQQEKDSSSHCDSFGLCQNGGRCYTGYRNPRSMIYKCFCPKGYTGLNCQVKHAYGHDSQFVFKSLRENYDRNRNRNYHYHYNYQNYEYEFVDGFGQSFLLLNTEISSDLSISRIEFQAAKAGRFLVSFIQVRGCDPDFEQCANKLYELHKNLKSTKMSDQEWHTYSSQLEIMLNGSESYLITASYQGFNTFDFKEPISVDKGSILCMTQIDGRLGGVLSKSPGLPDLAIQEAGLGDNVYTVDIADYLAKNATEVFFSVLVLDTSLMEGTVSDNSKLTFKASQPVTTLASGLECVNHLCVNGGVCVPLPLTDSYRCSCPINTLGKYCQILVVEETQTATEAIVETVETTTQAVDESADTTTEAIFEVEENHDKSDDEDI